MHNQTEFIRDIKENEGIIYKVTRVYADNTEDQKDLYQEIVYQLWKSYNSFKGESLLSTWMYRIALNTAITHLKKEKKKGVQIEIDDQLLNRKDDIDTETEEKISLLYAQIQDLNVIEKGIILLYLDGKSYDEIAAVTGFTNTNIGTRLARIKQKLKTKINK